MGIKLCKQREVSEDWREIPHVRGMRLATQMAWFKIILFQPSAVCRDVSLLFVKPFTVSKLFANYTRILLGICGFSVISNEVCPMLEFSFSFYFFFNFLMKQKRIVNTKTT